MGVVIIAKFIHLITDILISLCADDVDHGPLRGCTTWPSNALAWAIKGSQPAYLLARVMGGMHPKQPGANRPAPAVVKPVVTVGMAHQSSLASKIEAQRQRLLARQAAAAVAQPATG